MLPSVQCILKKLNEHADVNLVSVDELGIETALILQDKLDQGEWVIVAADRVPVQSDRVQSVCFLGEQALWPQGRLDFGQFIEKSCISSVLLSSRYTF